MIYYMFLVLIFKIYMISDCLKNTTKLFNSDEFQENNIFTDETYYTLIPKRRINHFYKAYNVNNITFDQLIKIQNFSPIDVVF